MMVVNENTTILNDVKQMLGIQTETIEFDIDILSHVNGAFFTLFQLGIGSDTPFIIDDTTTWSSFTANVPKNVVLDYLFLKTKIIFDPPNTSGVMDAYKDRISELEFRINVYVDNDGGIVSS